LVGHGGHSLPENGKALLVAPHRFGTPVANGAPLLDELLDRLVESHDWLLKVISLKQRHAM
jgi:hypothetical protein